MNDLSERVTALEGQTIGEYTIDIVQFMQLTAGTHPDYATAKFNVPEGQKVKAIQYYLTGGQNLNNMQIYVAVNSSTNLVVQACSAAPASATTLSLETVEEINDVSIGFNPNGQTTSGATVTLNGHVLITMGKA